MKMENLIEIRQGFESDLNFIFATWLKGLRWGNELYELIDSAIYFDHYRKIIEALLKMSEVRVACLKEDSDVIIGYSVSQGSKIHWVHVKESWRKMGIAKLLMPPDLKYYSHVTKAALSILQTHPGYLFNPFLSKEKE